LVPLWWRTRQAFDMAARAAALTHGHPCGYLSAGVLAAILRELIDGIELRSAVNESLHLLRHWPRHDATEAAVRKALDAVDRPLAREVDLAQHFGEAWVGEEALAIGLYAASVAVDYVDALTIAANHSGDSDTTAGIAGQIFGASRGMAALPKGWPNALDLYNEIGELTERLIEAAA
jgi:ADP-ribosylglycohydrolase